MNPGVRAFLGYTWIVASIVCFVLPLLISPADSVYHWTRIATENMAPAMFVISFPGSLLYVLFVFSLVSTVSFHDPSFASYLLLWLGFFVTGYVQWFWLMPRLFNRRQIIALDLAESVAKKNDGGHRSSRRRRRKRSRAKLGDAPLKVYDDAGRTPFERVIAGRSNVG